ncbi:MAG: hypothetical protein JSU85_01135, partial [Candidatus Zixiibacteriota bacterium]
MCQSCGDVNNIHAGIFIEGIHTGIQHMDMESWYYPGLNPYEIVYDDMAKHVSISTSGAATRYGEEPIDKYIQELLEE